MNKELIPGFLVMIILLILGSIFKNGLVISVTLACIAVILMEFLRDLYENNERRNKKVDSKGTRQDKSGIHARKNK
jgi:accessory gene regulator protein AgrB